MKVRIVHHNDPDGFCSAAIAFSKLSSDGASCVCEAIGYDDDKIKMYPDEHLVVVDFCFQPDSRMQEVIDYYGDRLTWIDHHETTMGISEMNPEVKGLRSVYSDGEMISACELTWQYFYPGEAMPRAVRMIGDWDTWRHARMVDYERARDALRFKTYLGFGFSVEEYLEFIKDDQYVDTVLEAGEVLLRYQDKGNAEFAERNAWEGLFNGIPAVFLNRVGNSKLFDSVYDPGKHKLMVGYVHNGNRWVVSLYSTHDDVHCGEMAKDLGSKSIFGSGGGHKGAAGFQATWSYFMAFVGV